MKLISVKNLSKKFRRTQNQQTAFGFLNNLFLKKDEFYALKNISFSVSSGDIVGIVGPNGSGKTTLLRILAGLYSKTDGTVAINGKVAAFLHTNVALENELDAYENIFLLGMIMGINKKDIEANLKKIIDFAEIRKFIRTPLRDFSTGMIQRLVLSILMYVEADIFLLDELIEASDFKFKERSYKKILKKISVGHKAAIFCSHELDIIERFCNKAMLLDKGKLIKFGPTAKVIKLYERSQQNNSQ